MLPDWVDPASRTIRKVAEIGGYVATAAALYAATGLPIPATKQYVDQAFLSMSRSLLGVERRLIKVDRNDLRRELDTLDKTARTTTDPVAQATHQRRIGEISDQLRDLEQDDDEVRKKIRILDDGRSSGSQTAR